MVNGEVCTLTKEEGKYRTVLEGFSQMGDWPITVEKLILSNGKVFELTKDHQVTVEVHRAHPQVKKVNIREREEEVKLDVAFQIEDPDQVLSIRRFRFEMRKMNFCWRKSLRIWSLRRLWNQGRYWQRVPGSDSGRLRCDTG